MNSSDNSGNGRDKGTQGQSSTYGGVWEPSSRYRECTYNNCGSKKEANKPSGKLSDTKSTSSGNSKGKS